MDSQSRIVARNECRVEASLGAVEQQLGGVVADVAHEGGSMLQLQSDNVACRYC